MVTKSFKTFWRPLQKMAAWLSGLGVTDTALERPGVLVAGLPRAGPGCDRGVCNAAHMRNVPGCKRMSRTASGSLSCTNPGCCGQLHPGGRGGRAAGAHPVPQKLIEQWVSDGQRLAKVLEDAGIKTDSVASELQDKSGRAMIEALIAGERNPARLADLALGRLRRKTEELQMACDGRFTAAHAQMGRLHLDAYDHLTAKIAELDDLVAEAAAPFAALIARLVTIPGIGQRTAEVIIAETGGDMTRFPTAARLAAWAGLAPGDNESAGKRKKAPTRKGDAHLRTAMVEAVWAAPGAPPPAPAPGSAAWPAGSARATRKRLPWLSLAPCCASPGRSCATTATTPTAKPAPTSL